MILNLLRNNHYFIVYKIAAFKETENLNPAIMKFIKSYFWWRGRSVDYIEPHITKNGMETYFIIGSVKSAKTVNRKALIFLLELYAEMEDKSFKVSNDFEKETKIIDQIEVNIYTVKK